MRKLMKMDRQTSLLKVIDSNQLNTNSRPLKLSRSRYTSKRAWRANQEIGSAVRRRKLNQLLTFIKLIAMNTHILIVILSAPCCLCFAAYELFPGFRETRVDDISDTTTDSFLNPAFNAQLKTTQGRVLVRKNDSELQYHTTTTSQSTPFTTVYTDFDSVIKITESKSNWTEGKESLSNKTKSKAIKFSCPDEVPTNIGPYEIPSQRDLVVFTRNILLDMFESYNRDAFYLLKDIRQATKATASVETKCKANKIEYRKCVKRVSSQCQQITKNLVTTLENQKQEITELIEDKICNLAEMKTDPIHMITLLAQEKVSLEFALPGFLHLLNACSSYCIQSESNYHNKPVRHMTDQDLVIKHFLTRKNYIDLIMDSRH